MKDNPYLNRCIEKIVQKINAGEPNTWSDKVFKDLSDAIQESAGVVISVLTLKRLLGRIVTKGGYTPQEATKDALAKYLGFLDWNAFIDTVPIAESNKEDSDDEKTNFIKRGWKLVAGVFLIMLLIYFIYPLISHKLKSNAAISFTGELLSGLAPHTATFIYDVSNYPDSVFLDFDDNQIIYMPREKNFFRHGYLIPHYFNVRMISGKNELGNVRVMVKSPAWEARLGYANFEPTVMLVPLYDTNFLYASPAMMVEKGLDKTKGYYVSDYRFYDDFNTQGDNFDFSFKAINSKAMGGLYCQDLSIMIQCENSNIIFNLVRPSCSVATMVTISDVSINGQYNDISSLSTDPEKWETIRLVVKNYNAQFYVNDKNVFEVSYKKELGAIKGFTFATMGSGAFDDIVLKNGAGEIKYENNFGK